MKLVYQYMAIFFNFLKHQIIFIHYKSRIATAIRGLWWMKMKMVNSGSKGLNAKKEMSIKLNVRYLHKFRLKLSVISDSGQRS